MKNTHISERKFRAIVKCFSNDCTATVTASLAGISRPSINRVFMLLRRRIAETSIASAKELGEFEVDESYFGARRVRGKRGRGAAGKTPVFGILKRGGKVFVNIVKNCSKQQLMPIIQGKVLEGSTVYSDGWKAYDGLLLNGYDHYRVFHSADEFARGKSHVNGIEAFWSFAKRRLSKFNGMTEETFMLHLKECEWRWNERGNNLSAILFSLLREKPL